MVLLALLGLLSIPLFFISALGVIYPFPPFRTRKRALIVVAASLVCFVGAGIGVGQEEQKAQRQAAAAEQVLHDENGPARAGSASSTAASAETSTGAPSKPEAQADGQSEAKTEARARLEEKAERETRIRDYLAQDDFILARVQYSAISRKDLASEDFAQEIETAVLNKVTPLPASDHEGNLNGYRLLAAIRPGNTTYQEKIEHYRSARAAAERAARQRAFDAITPLRVTEDKVEGVTFYHHPNEPRYLNTRSTVYLYIGRRGSGRPSLRMVTTYAADRWLFVNRVDAAYLGIKEPLAVGGFKRDNNTEIWEWKDVAVDRYQLEVLRALSKAPESILRFTGQQYRKDVTLSARDKKAIADMIEVYELMLSQS